MTHLDPSSARTEMRNYILENYLFTDDQAALTDSDWFLEAGILDSTGIMEIIFFLEEQFSIKVEEEEMVPENLDSIDNLVDYIVKKQPDMVMLTLPDMLETTVGLYPDSTAIIHGDTHTSYRTLWQKICAVSAYMKCHISRGDCVALLMDNSEDYIAACYGTWRAGGVVVGLNTALKAKELCRLLNHCRARVLICEKPKPDLIAQLENSDIRIITVNAPEQQVSEEDWKKITSTKTEAASCAIDMHSLAMIIYTSGTTGHPKGVMLSHANLSANMQSIISYLSITANDIALCVLPFFYSYGNSVLHTHVISGSTLVLENTFAFPPKILELMQQHSVTAFYGVPSTYYMLLARTQLEKYNLSSLRFCAQAGGPMDSAKIDDFRKGLPGTAFIVMYGQTEACARLAYLAADQLATHPGSVGKAIPGVELKICDKQGKELPSEQLGEVCARGENIMLGYLHDREETEKSIIDGWLHTGDLGYCDNDGFIYLRGRNSEMIKTGAYRVSPREIEEIIASHDAVVEVAVVGVADPVLGSAIRACVVCRNKEDADKPLKQALLRLCKQELPMYKIPRYLDFMSALPKTASGKVKKFELAEWQINN